jgi:hypothetical protein
MDNCIIILVAILLVSSYVFQKSKDTHTNQLLYVIFGLGVIIAMKHFYGHNTPENFENNNQVTATGATGVGVTGVGVTGVGVGIGVEEQKPNVQNWNNIQAVTSDNFTGLKKILSYLKGVEEADLDKEETKKIINELTQQFNKFQPEQLDHQLTQITTLLQNLQNVSNLTGVPEPKESKDENILEKRSIKESQFLQDFEIKKLEKEIDELQKLYTTYVDKKVEKTYKKIPIYSSCVMEANGTTSTCQPNLSNIALQTDAQKEHNQALVVSGGSEVDPVSQSIDKLIKTISDSGISISMQSK